MVARFAFTLPARHWLATILAAALALRLVILAATPALGLQIVDEQHYHVLATHLINGDGFASASGLTSLRPPLYPAVVAGVWWLTASRSNQAVRAFQIVLSLATIVLAYVMVRRLYDEKTALIAAAIVGFYPALIIANYFLLTETLFTFLLTAALAALVALVERPRVAVAALAGALLGLAALTRSIMWPFPIVLAPALLWLLPATWPRRIACVAVLVAAHASVIAPWAIRNTRLQGVPVIVDTMGGMNLRMGNYEFTPHNRIWDAVSETGDRSWIVGLPVTPPGGGQWTEGLKERWARDQAVQFMRAHPALTVWRMCIKFSDFWGLDRDFAAGIQQGLFHPPAWAAILAVASLAVAFPLLLGLAILGAWFCSHENWRVHLVLLLVVAFVTALHSIVFGHPRYRLPLTPVLAAYGGAALSARAWVRLREGWRVALVPAALAMVLAGIWATQFLVRDWPFVQRLLEAG